MANLPNTSQRLLDENKAVTVPWYRFFKDLQRSDGSGSFNTPITPATNTKVSYDSDGLITAGTSATTDDIIEGSNLYFTDERARLAKRVQSFTPTASQTVFTLSAIPIAGEIITSQVFVNGQKLQLTTSYTVAGSQLTINLPYSLSTNDDLEIYY